MSRVFELSPTTKFSNPILSGWYKTKNNDQANLIVSSSNSDVQGTIRYNETLNTFEGFNGNVWITFNALKGDKGDKGDDFDDVITFNNLLGGSGNVIASGNIDVSKGQNIVSVRSLASGNTKLNDVSISTMTIQTYPTTIQLTSNPLPFEWNNSSISQSILINTDGSLKAYGTVETWMSSPNIKISKGQAVRIVEYENGLCVEPLRYVSPMISPFKKNLSFLGIALNDAMPLSSVRICIKGITSVLLSSSIPKEFVSSTDLKDVGLPGIIAPDAGIFYCPMKPSTTTEFIKAGVFLKSGDITTNGGYVLFRIL